MFRSQYDSDITTWSPAGRIHQIEYAMEAVKQGSAAVGLKSKTHSIVVVLKRASSELGSHQQKVSIYSIYCFIICTSSTIVYLMKFRVIVHIYLKSMSIWELLLLDLQQMLGSFVNI